jgi:membrane-associated phospholipid phosphatase
MAQLKRLFIATALIFAVWFLLVKMRPWVIVPRCSADPKACLSASINVLDRYGMGENSGTAEEFSNYGQITAGILAFLVPLAFWFRNRAIPGWKKEALKDLLIIGQVVALNGALTETIRLIVQRPRPYVYDDPGFYGKELQNYTSFVSGHTSFSTAAAAALILVLVSRRAPRGVIRVAGILCGAVAISTGVCRVFAGRHFITDVLSGALCGLASALIVAAVHRGFSNRSPASNYS